MGYIESNLMKGESIIHKGKIHWMRFFWGTFWFMFGIFLFIGSAKAPQPNPMGPLLIMIGIALITGAAIEYLTSEFVVTNKRVFLKRGLIKRQTVELLLSKIEGLSVDQGIIGRILNYGTIVPSGTGGSKQVFSLVAKPISFRQKVSEQLDTAKTS